MEQFIGEIRTWAGPFAPIGWQLCDGSLLPISEYEALFTLIGTIYGGDGQSTFAVPDLRGRVPVHHGNGTVLGETGGVETVTLNVNQIPPHRHTVWGSVDPATTNSLANAVPASMPSAGTGSVYGSVDPIRAINPGSLTPSGDGRPHDNMQPYLVITFIIATTGVWPDLTESEE